MTTSLLGLCYWCYYFFSLHFFIFLFCNLWVMGSHRFILRAWPPFRRVPTIIDGWIWRITLASRWVVYCTTGRTASIGTHISLIAITTKAHHFATLVLLLVVASLVSFPTHCSNTRWDVRTHTDSDSTDPFDSISEYWGWLFALAVSTISSLAIATTWPVILLLRVSFVSTTSWIEFLSIDSCLFSFNLKSLRLRNQILDQYWLISNWVSSVSCLLVEGERLQRWYFEEVISEVLLHPRRSIFQ